MLMYMYNPGVQYLAHADGWEPYNERDKRDEGTCSLGWLCAVQILHNIAQQ